VNIVLFGPPGAGKGTQASNIAKHFALHKISTGDLLRNEIKKKTTLGNEINSIISKGLFVSDNIINNLVLNILSFENFKNNLIFDGYPRNLNQAKKLDSLMKKNNQKISCVLSLDVDKDVIVKRILGRQVCTKCGSIFNKYYYPATDKNHACLSKFLETRSDDNEATILHRYNTYLDKTLPILNFYKDQNLLNQINGSYDIDQIFKEIRAIIASLET